MKPNAILAVAGVGAALLLAACGGGNSDDNSTTNDTSKSNTVLADASGAPLYLSDQERDGMVRCTDGCTSIWIPATPGSVKAAAVSDAGGKLGTLKRPDGSAQATFDGRPLYRFAEDGNDGKATGDGVSDSFAGRHFTWHSAAGEGGNASSSGGSGGAYSY